MNDGIVSLITRQLKRSSNRLALLKHHFDSMRMAFIQEIKTHPMRFSKSIAVFFINVSFGLVSGLLGPTLLDLQIQVGASIDKIAYVMPARSVGIVLGSLMSGFIYTRINFQLLAAICMSISVVMIV